MRSLQIAAADETQNAPSDQQKGPTKQWTPLLPLVPCEPANKADEGPLTDRSIHEAFGVEIEPGPGAFLGLRAALVFNVGLGVLGLIGYEVWSMVAHWR